MITKSHFFSLSYNSQDRWLGYWHQINEVLKLQPRKVLEVGIGNALVSTYLSASGINVTTVDINKNLKPDIVASVLNLPLRDDSFDLVLVAEVLEHLPFNEFISALSEIKRVTRKYALISLPDSRHTLINLGVKIPFIKRINIFLKIPSFKKHIFDEISLYGRHYWEMGKRGYSVRKVKDSIKENSFKIISDFVPFDTPGTHYFILEK